MPAQSYDISFQRGNDYSVAFVLSQDAAGQVPFDPTGCSALMQVRQNPCAPVLYELSSDNGKLIFQDVVVNNATVVALTAIFSSADSLNLPPVSPLGYDVELTDSQGSKTTIVGGAFAISEVFSRDY